MSTLEREIERTYEVTLTPLDGPIDGRRVPYDEPRRVRLRYSPEDADQLGPRDEAAIDEALKRAIRLERKEFHTDPGTVFEGHVRYISGRLVDYLPRSRPRPRSNP